jgi:very-short-patch-repair endonuclease
MLDVVEHNQFKISLDSTSSLNFTFQQNAIPLIRHITLEGSEQFSESKLLIESHPAFFQPTEIRIGKSDKDQNIYLSNPKLNFDLNFLLHLNENIKGYLNLKWLDLDGQLLAVKQQDIEVLTVDTWGGEKQPLELLACFSQPNAASLAPILKRASGYLVQKNLGSLNGYSDKSPEQVLNQVNAIWQALNEQNLHYIVNPASYIQHGQRIRLAKQILDEKMACCLDSTMLMSSLLEQIGLDPIVMIFQGHSFLGVWLHETPVADVLIDDLQALRKYMELGAITFIETTLLTSQASLKQAIESAQEYLRVAEKIEQFYVAVDIRQSRLRGVRPISTQLDVSQNLDQDEIGWAAASLPAYAAMEESENVASRVQRWLRRLLDLSLRNKLLNFKDNRLSIPLQCSEKTLASLEDALAENKGFFFQSVDYISLKDVTRENEAQHVQNYIDENLHRQLLFSGLDSETLNKRLVEVYRASRTALEEGGANTLFLAVGFLEWKESEKAQKTYKAPLLLIPVRMTRESAKSGYRLWMYDDEPRFNSTLLQLLRQDFEIEVSGLDPLPADGSGVDVNAVLQIVRRAVVNMRGWEVTAEAAIGQFSFSKYLMWRDLSLRIQQLKEQAVVHHLIETPREPFKKQDAFPHPAELDQKYQPQQLFTPLSSDSSQLAAVMSAALGRTFVLSGPPGTGKSQTITNMVAQCLADGKSVLFVSEKMAALDVVYRRLNQIGLGHLCLQLHSAKAQKIEVLDQLRERAENNNNPYAITPKETEQEWQLLSQHLVQSRDVLNQHVKVLHQQHPIGWSLFDAMSDELLHREIESLRFDLNIQYLTHQARNQLKDLGVSAFLQHQQISTHALDILHGFAEGSTQNFWNLLWQDQYLQTQQRLAELIPQIQSLIQTWQDICQFKQAENLQQLQADLDIYQRLLSFNQQHDLKLLKIIEGIDIRQISEAKAVSTEIAQSQTRLIFKYDPSIYHAELKQIEFKWREASAKFWPWSWFGKYQLRSLLRGYQADHQRPSAMVVENDLPLLMKIQNHQQQFKEIEHRLSDKLQSYWQGEKTDWAQFENIAQAWVQLKNQVAERISNPIVLQQAIEFASQHDLLQAARDIEALQQKYTQLLPDQQIQTENLRSYTQIPFTTLLTRQQKLQNVISEWRHWLNWQGLKTELQQQGLTRLTEYLQQYRSDQQGSQISTPKLNQEQVALLIDINLARQWIIQQFSLHPELNQFNGELQQQKILKFSQQDRDHQQFASEEITRRWYKVFENPDEFKKQWALLNKELGKKRRHIPVRELIKQIPDVITGLKPCMLMSPLSVAQYLDPESKFDVVIFDEASQIPVWDAIGALARGEQSIVVGDNKQMPPTSFFGKGDTEEVDEEVTEDLESILDECLAAQLPELVLNWHYRSRYESLIQFSNQKYYKGELLTFPAPVAKDKAIQLHSIEGIYDKGDTRTNKAEAQAIVQFILQHLRDQLALETKQTIGVVTFNITQQKLIEDLLDNELANHPELEQLSREGFEPLFIKNLENVQGDERDIIIFSITYAPDQQGKLLMNFGALNRQGGQRRLNVAITRARQGLHVFSTLRPEQIDLSRTSSEGVRDLKDFLSFAQTGQMAYYAQSIEKEKSKDELMLYLHTQLQQLGWKVDLAVGSGESRIDLAVQDPHVAGQYLTGILVDGDDYAKAATARDRDQLRPSVLNGLGWNILQLWTVEWWLDPKTNLEKLQNQLNQRVNLSKLRS